MKLRQILEGLLDGPLDKSPTGPQQDQLAKGVAGDDGEANTQVKQQLQQNAQAEKKMNPKGNQELKGTLQRLATTKWDPKNSQFQKLSAKVMGAMK